MDNLNLSVTDGQIKIVMQEAAFGKFTLTEAGFGEDTYEVEGGNLRIKIELGYIQDVNFYKMPILEFEYTEKISTSEWIVEFNGVNILEKKDHSGQATVLLLNRNKMKDLQQRHENILLIHGDFSEVVHLKSNSAFHLLETPGQ